MMSTSSTDATNDFSHLKEALHSLYSEKIEDRDAVMGRDQMVPVEYEVLVNLYIVCKRLHKKKPELTLSFAFDLEGVPGEEKESNLFNALLKVAKKHDSYDYPDEAEVHALQDLYFKMEAPLRQKLGDLTTCNGYDYDKFHYNNHAKDEETGEVDARVNSDNLHKHDGALEEKSGDSELNKLKEIKEASHNAISKELQDKVDNDGNVRDDSDAVVQNPIRTEVKKDEVTHIAEGDDEIRGEHGDFKEHDCITEVAVDKDSVEVTCDADDSKIN